MDKNKRLQKPMIVTIHHFFEQLHPSYNWVVLAIYIAAMATVSSFHEPWFDEAQSWLIARDASLVDIIFNIPHYEGHPPFWHLYLVPFAKLGLPYELGIKSASIILNAVSMGILLFKAPFPKIYRFALPFTFYFFYQYGVISRCYSLLILGFVLAGLTWAKKQQHPFKFALSLMVLCASSAYGILFAGGIAIVWVLEIIKSRTYPKSFKKLFSDKRLYALLLLLVFAVYLAYTLMPRPDTYAVNLRDSKSSFLIRLFFMLVLAPMESFFFRSIPGRYFLQNISLTPVSMIASTFIFILFALIIGAFAIKKKGLSLLLIPYVPFAFFSASLYFSSHHLGVVSAFFLFWFWAVSSTSPRFGTSKSDSIVKILINALIVISLAVSISWSVSAADTDTRTNYSSSTKIAAFIKTHQLEDALLMSVWYVPDDDGVKANPDHQLTPSFNAYFDTNIIYNFNNGNNALTYETHKTPSSADTEATYARWAAYGPPDVLLGNVRLAPVFGNSVTKQSYSLVALIPEAQIVKNHEYKKPSAFTIYMRNDLLDDYGLVPITDVDWSLYTFYGDEEPS